MKPIVEKLPLSGNKSFLASIFRTPDFEVPWHQHIELEMILFLEGEGTAFIGNYVGEFTAGDIFFLGPNLPHTFQKLQKNLVTSALVVQFREDFWGKEFLQLPENRNLRAFFDKTAAGVKVPEKVAGGLRPQLLRVEHAEGMQRLLALYEVLDQLSSSPDLAYLSTQDKDSFVRKNSDRIDRIFQYTIDSFQEPLNLGMVAEEAGMSVPAFCHYFRKHTKKTYIDFLNEVRIGYACQLLIDTHKPVAEVCFESGFNTFANFNKQFLKVKNLTPSGYRKNFREKRIA